MKLLTGVIAGRFRRLWSPVCIALALITLTSTALAAQPLTGTFSAAIRGREVTYLNNGKPIHRWAGLYTLKLDTGEDVPVYCVQFGVRVNYGDRYRSDGPIQQLPNGCQIRYLLQTYPASTAKTADEAAARQLAIWAFSDNIDPKTITGTTTLLRDRVIALVNEARNAACPATHATVPDLTLEPPTANASAGSTLTYTLRLAPAGIVPAVQVVVAGPAVLVGGQQQASIALDAQGVATFGVTSTDAGNSTISVRAPYQLDSGVVFSPIDDNHKTQRLVMAETKKFVAQAVAQASWVGAAGAPSPTPPPAPTEQHGSKEQPTPTEQPPTPTVEVAPEAAVSPEVAAEQVMATAEVAASQPAGGAPPPRHLPNTGAPTDAMRPISLGIAALLLVGGLLLRRRGARR